MIAPNDLILFLGFAAQGDFGPFSIYTNVRGSIVIFLKAWLKDPTTIRQKQHRDRMRAAAKDWRRLTPAARQTWERTTTSLSLPLNGYNLWTFWHMTSRSDLIKTLEHQSGHQLLPPDYA